MAGPERGDAPAIDDVARSPLDHEDLGASMLDAFAIAELSDRTHAVRCEAGHTLFREGDPGDAMYLVRSGRLEVVTASGERVRLLGPGDIAGELALLDGAPRSASVRAIRDSTLLRLSCGEFDELLRDNSGFSSTLVRVLGAKLRTRAAGPLPRLPSGVIAVVGLDAEAPVADLAHAMSASMGLATRVIAWTGPAIGDEAEWDSGLDAAEREHERVILVAADAGVPWEAFCIRQADRVVGVVGAAPRGRCAHRPDWDLVLTGAAARPIAAREWLHDLEPRAWHRVARVADGPDVDRLVRRVTGCALGLVLSGGGARGFAHLGVLETLERAEVSVDRIGGTSIGALVGALAANGLPVAEIVRRCRSELVERRPFSDYRWPRTSLIRARRAREMLERMLGRGHLEELMLDFFCVSADLTDAEVVVHRRGPLVEAVGASMSLPGLAPPVQIGEQLLVDGGVLNNTPVDVMAAQREGPVVAVDVMGHRLARNERHRLPSIVETLARATVIGSHAHARTRLAEADLVLTPELGAVGLLDFSSATAAIDAGRRAGEAALAAGWLSSAPAG